MYFEKIRVLGKGSYGTVYLIKDSGNKRYALKKMSYNKELLKSCYNELNILKILNSEYIVKVVSYFKKYNSFNIIMEYASNGDLSLFIKNRKIMNNKLNDNEIFHYISSITKGLIHLHDNKIIHRDLKPSNILITKENKIKLTDFGISKILNHQLAVYTKIGTPYYMSPETLDKNGYSYPVDFWALGCIFFELLTFSKPFEANSIYSLYLKIKKGNFNTRKIPIKYLQIIKGLLCRDSSRRLSGRKVLYLLKNSNISKSKLQPIRNKYSNYRNDKDLYPVKKDLYPVKKDLYPVKKDLYPVKKDLYPVKKDLYPVKKDLYPVKKDLKPINRKYDYLRRDYLRRDYLRNDLKKNIKIPKKRKYNLNPINNKKKDFIKINIQNVKNIDIYNKRRK